jgi:aminoglycoside phosphotransferase (APT) family kinase protein
MHADEVDIDGALVRRLVATQFPAWGRLPIERVSSSGTDNALFRLGEEMVVRLPRRERDVQALAKERRWLPELAPHLSLAIPIPLAEGEPGEGYPFEWSVYRWLEGEDATVGDVADRHRLAVDVASFVSGLHAVDPTGGPAPGRHNVERGEPIRRRDASTRSSLAALGETVDAEPVLAVWESCLEVPDWEADSVWIHGDLDARNILVAGGRAKAVIDWGCLAVGDPACDVMVAWKVLPVAARPAFRTALGVDDATWARARGWALWSAVGVLSYYTPETNPVLVSEARRWLAEVLADEA